MKYTTLTNTQLLIMTLLTGLIAAGINVLFTMYLHPPKVSPNPLLWLGFVLVAAGASLVLYFKPQG